jgi:hypothetical protein
MICFPLPFLVVDNETRVVSFPLYLYLSLPVSISRGLQCWFSQLEERGKPRRLWRFICVSLILTFPWVELALYFLCIPNPPTPLFSSEITSCRLIPPISPFPTSVSPARFIRLDHHIPFIYPYLFIPYYIPILINASSIILSILFSFLLLLLRILALAFHLYPP